MLRPCYFILVCCLISCSSTDRRRSQLPWTDSLRVELLRRVAEDQAGREQFAAAFRAGSAPDSALINTLQASDASNTLWLRNAVAQIGWPLERKAVAGPAGGPRRPAARFINL